MKRENGPSHVPFREQTQRGSEGSDSCPVFESRWTLNNKRPSNVQSRVKWLRWRCLLPGFFTYWFRNNLRFKLLSQVASNGKAEHLLFVVHFDFDFILIPGVSFDTFTLTEQCGIWRVQWTDGGVLLLFERRRLTFLNNCLWLCGEQISNQRLFVFFTA